MDISIFIEDAQHFKEGKRAAPGARARYTALTTAVTDCVTKYNVPRATLYEQLGELAKRFGRSLRQKATTEKKAWEIIQDHLKDLARGKGGNLIQLYVAWLWGFYPRNAQVLYKKFGIKARGRKKVAESIKPSSREQPSDSDSIKSPSEMRPSPEYGSWDRLIAAYAQFTNVAIVTVKKRSMDLIDFEETGPVSDCKLRLGQNFFFRL
jgi:hypothetical protein